MAGALNSARRFRFSQALNHDRRHECEAQSPHVLDVSGERVSKDLVESHVHGLANYFPTLLRRIVANMTTTETMEHRHQLVQIVQASHRATHYVEDLAEHV